MGKSSGSSTQEAAVDKSAKKVAAFKSVGNTRVRAALSQLDKLFPLTNRKVYVYDETQVAKIVGALQARVDKLKKAFELGAGATAGEVEL